MLLGVVFNRFCIAFAFSAFFPVTETAHHTSTLILNDSPSSNDKPLLANRPSIILPDTLWVKTPLIVPDSLIHSLSVVCADSRSATKLRERRFAVCEISTVSTGSSKIELTFLSSAACSFTSSCIFTDSLIFAVNCAYALNPRTAVKFISFTFKNFLALYILSVITRKNLAKNEKFSLNLFRNSCDSYVTNYFKAACIPAAAADNHATACIPVAADNHAVVDTLALQLD